MPKRLPVATETRATLVPICPCPHDFLERHQGHQPGCSQGPTATVRPRPPRRSVPKQVADRFADRWSDPLLTNHVAELVTAAEAAALADLLAALGRPEAADLWRSRAAQGEEPED